MTQTLTDGRQISLSTETEQGVVIKATDVEVDTGTEDTKYVTPKGVKDNYGKAPALVTGTLTFSNSNGSQVIPHGFSVIPGNITFTMNSGQDQTTGYYVTETTSQACIDTDGGTASAVFKYVDGGDVSTWTVTGLDTTNITLTRVVAGTPGLASGTFLIKSTN